MIVRYISNCRHFFAVSVMHYSSWETSFSPVLTKVDSTRGKERKER